MTRPLTLGLVLAVLLSACGGGGSGEASRSRACDDGGSGGVVIDGVCL